MIRAVVTDIEGTTSSLSFVKDVLFPYARERIADYVAQHHADSDVAKLLSDARHEAGNDGMPLDSVVQQLQDWIDEDRKVTPLKALQGLIWEAGYAAGDFQGHVYPDAVAVLSRWRDDGLRLYVYSSGSVHAQKLLFGHTEQGDITGLFDDYFDTRIGAKVESDSYRHIAAQLNLEPHEILFLSDVEAELDAARAAGIHTACLVREARPLQHAVHRQYRDFSQIKLAAFDGPNAAGAASTASRT